MVINRTKCVECDHLQVCGFKDGYLDSIVELEKVKKPEFMELSVNCKYYKPRGMNILTPRE